MVHLPGVCCERVGLFYLCNKLLGRMIAEGLRAVKGKTLVGRRIAAVFSAPS
jgi:hypothetical protein